MENTKEILLENNKLLKEIKSMLEKLLSPEYNQKQEIHNLLTNILANLLIYKQNR